MDILSYILGKKAGGGGGEAVLINKSISANGTYNASADSADGYKKVEVSVPASAVDTGTKPITSNGNGQDVVGYAAVDVAVPNSYSAGDEGKVVSDGALVAQGSDTVTSNGTVDTTLISSLTVDVSADNDAEFKDVNLYDYDGTRVYSYTSQEFAALSALPANPSHDDLTAQGWNWTLEDAKSFVQKYRYLSIGQIYKPKNDRVRLFIKTEYDNFTFHITVGATVSEGITIHWGDGDTLTLSGTNASDRTHTYATAGEYVVEIEKTDGTLKYGNINSGTGIFGGLSGANAMQSGYAVKRIDWASWMPELKRYVLGGARNCEILILPNGTNVTYIEGMQLLKSIIVPSGVTYLGGADISAVNLKAICFPKGSSAYLANNISFSLTHLKELINISPNTVTLKGLDCRELEHYVAPDEVTSITATVANNCNGMRHIVIGSGVTTIGNSAFFGCVNLEDLHIAATTPPTLQNASVFQGIPATAKIYVPYSADHSVLAAYQAATNWSTYASQMQEEPQ